MTADEIQARSQHHSYSDVGREIATRGWGRSCAHDVAGLIRLLDDSAKAVSLLAFMAQTLDAIRDHALMISSVARSSLRRSHPAPDPSGDGMLKVLRAWADPPPPRDPRRLSKRARNLLKSYEDMGTPLGPSTTVYDLFLVRGCGTRTAREILAWRDAGRP